MTLVIIVLNAAVFLFQRTLGSGFENFVQIYGLVPAGAVDAFHRREYLLLNGTMAAAEGGGVAWWAHVGGFATGMFFVFPFRKYR